MVRNEAGRVNREKKRPYDLGARILVCAIGIRPVKEAVANAPRQKGGRDMDLLDTKAAAARVGLSTVTLERYRLTGAGPQFAKLGKAVRYRPADLDAWVAARLVNSTSASDAAAA